MNEDRFAAVLHSQGVPADAKIWRANASDVTLARATAFAATGGAAIATLADTPIDLALWRAAFDAGFVPIRSDAEQDIFLRSDLVIDHSQLGGRTRGTIAMSSLGSNGRFANQLFQYAYLKFYALRHACEVRASDAWDGKKLFGLEEEAVAPNTFPELRYYAFDNDDLVLWDMQAPPADVDLWGYFQEMPLCWGPHRALLRRFYAVRPELDKPIAAAWAELTENGQRPLIAAHIRRGDYVNLHREGLPWYRPAPEAWSAAWMDEVAKSAQRPVFYVATDEPAVLSAFQQFNARSAADLSVAGALPALLDFEIMRRADHLALANSSFSRMAAVLASAQKSTVIPDFERKRVVPYEPWIDQAFWGRFEAAEKASPSFGYSPEARLARSLMIRRDRGQLALAESTHAEDERVWAENQVKMEAVWVENQQLNNSLKTLRNDQFRFSEKANLWVRERDEKIVQLIAERNEATAAAAAPPATPPQAPPPPDFARRVTARAALSIVLIADRTLGDLSPRARAGFAPMIADLRARRIGAFLRRCRNLALRKRIPADPAIVESKVAEPAYAAPADAPLTLANGWAAMPYAALEQAKGSALTNADFVILCETPLPTAAAEALCALLAAEPRLKSLRVGDGDTAVRIARAQTLRAVVEDKVNVIRELDQPSSACGLIDPRFIDAPSTLHANVPGNALAPDAPFWNVDPIGGGERLAIAYTPCASDSGKPHALIVMPWMTLGGSEIVFLDVLSHLIKSWQFTIVTTLPDDHILRAKFQAITQDIVHAGNIFDQERIAALIVALARARGSSAILSSNAALMHDRAAEIAAALPQVKLFDILHNDLPGGHIEGAAKATTAIARHIAVSHRVGGALRSRGVPARRISVIANGVDTDLFAPSDAGRAATRAVLGIPDNVLLLAFVGRLSPEKRPSTAIDIAALVSAVTPARLIMVGDGSLERDVHAQARAHGALVTFQPPMTRDAVRDIYRAADFLVLPSTIEGMPLSALEALSTGCPVAATDVGELAAVIRQGENGFLAPVQTPLDLANALILGFRDHKAMREAARASIITSGRTKATMVQTYERVLSEALSAAVQR